jgi:hypothetical protein
MHPGAGIAGRIQLAAPNVMVQNDILRVIRVDQYGKSAAGRDLGDV